MPIPRILRRPAAPRPRPRGFGRAHAVAALAALGLSVALSTPASGQAGDDPRPVDLFLYMDQSIPILREAVAGSSEFSFDMAQRTVDALGALGPAASGDDPALLGPDSEVRIYGFSQSGTGAGRCPVDRGIRFASAASSGAGSIAGRLGDALKDRTGQQYTDFSCLMTAIAENQDIARARNRGRIPLVVIASDFLHDTTGSSGDQALPATTINGAGVCNLLGAYQQGELPREINDAAERARQRHPGAVFAFIRQAYNTEILTNGGYRNCVTATSGPSQSEAPLARLLAEKTDAEILQPDENVVLLRERLGLRLRDAALRMVLPTVQVSARNTGGPNGEDGLWLQIDTALDPQSRDRFVIVSTEVDGHLEPVRPPLELTAGGRVRVHARLNNFTDKHGQAVQVAVHVRRDGEFQPLRLVALPYVVPARVPLVTAPLDLQPAPGETRRTLTLPLHNRADFDVALTGIRESIANGNRQLFSQRRTINSEETLRLPLTLDVGGLDGGDRLELILTLEAFDETWTETVAVTVLDKPRLDMSGAEATIEYESFDAAFPFVKVTRVNNPSTVPIAIAKVAISVGGDQAETLKLNTEQIVQPGELGQIRFGFNGLTPPNESLVARLRQDASATIRLIDADGSETEATQLRRTFRRIDMDCRVQDRPGSFQWSAGDDGPELTLRLTPPEGAANVEAFRVRSASLAGVAVPLDWQFEDGGERLAYRLRFNTESSQGALAASTPSAPLTLALSNAGNDTICGGDLQIMRMPNGRPALNETLKAQVATWSPDGSTPGVRTVLEHDDVETLYEIRSVQVRPRSGPGPNREPSTGEALQFRLSPEDKYIRAGEQFTLTAYRDSLTAAHFQNAELALRIGPDDRDLVIPIENSEAAVPRIAGVYWSDVTAELGLEGAPPATKETVARVLLAPTRTAPPGAIIEHRFPSPVTWKAETRPPPLLIPLTGPQAGGEYTDLQRRTLGGERIFACLLRPEEAAERCGDQARWTLIDTPPLNGVEVTRADMRWNFIAWVANPRPYPLVVRGLDLVSTVDGRTIRTVSAGAGGELAPADTAETRIDAHFAAGEGAALVKEAMRVRVKLTGVADDEGLVLDVAPPSLETPSPTLRAFLPGVEAAASLFFDIADYILPGGMEYFDIDRNRKPVLTGEVLVHSHAFGDVRGRLKVEYASVSGGDPEGTGGAPQTIGDATLLPLAPQNSRGKELTRIGYAIDVPQVEGSDLVEATFSVIAPDDAPVTTPRKVFSNQVRFFWTSNLVQYGLPIIFSVFLFLLMFQSEKFRSIPLINRLSSGRLPHLAAALVVVFVVGTLALHLISPKIADVLSLMLTWLFPSVTTTALVATPLAERIYLSKTGKGGRRRRARMDHADRNRFFSYVNRVAFVVFALGFGLLIFLMPDWWPRTSACDYDPERFQIRLQDNGAPCL